MSRYSTELREEVWTAFTLSGRAIGPTDLQKEFLPEIPYGTVANVARELAEEGFLTIETGLRSTKLYKPSGKEFVFAPPVETPRQESLFPKSSHVYASPSKISSKVVKRRPTPPPAPAPQRNDNLEDWATRVEETLQMLNKFDEALNSMKAGLASLRAVVLDFSKDFARLGKVKDILKGIEDLARRNI